jgi:hypothetical protein
MHKYFRKEGIKVKFFTILTALFPSFVMIAISLIGYANIFELDEISLKSQYVVSLIFYFPLAFFLQGIASAFLKRGVFAGVVVSLVTFVIVMFRDFGFQEFGFYQR